MNSSECRSQAIALYRRWIDELWNGQLAAADEVVAPSFVVHARGGGPGTMEQFNGPEGIRAMVEAGRAPFESVHFQVDVGPIVSDDLLSGRWIAEGEYRGGIPGAAAASGKRLSFAGNDILRFAQSGSDGTLQFTEYWSCADALELMQQLEVSSLSQ